MFIVICPECGKTFELDRWCINHRNDYNGLFCDVTCPECGYEEDIEENE